MFTAHQLPALIGLIALALACGLGVGWVIGVDYGRAKDTAGRRRPAIPGELARNFLRRNSKN